MRTNKNKKRRKARAFKLKAHLPKKGKKISSQLREERTPPSRFDTTLRPLQIRRLAIFLLCGVLLASSELPILTQCFDLGLAMKLLQSHQQSISLLRDVLIIGNQLRLVAQWLPKDIANWIS